MLLETLGVYQKFNTSKKQECLTLSFIFFHAARYSIMYPNTVEGEKIFLFYHLKNWVLPCNCLTNMFCIGAFPKTENCDGGPLYM